MISRKAFAWLAAGALGLGSSAALAQYQPEDEAVFSEDEEVLEIQQEQQFPETDQPTNLGSEQQGQLQEPLQATEPAEQQSLEGTVIDAASYLLHGEQAVENLQSSQQDQQQMQQQAQPPYVLLTDAGEAYLIVEQPTQQNGARLQPPLEDPAQQPIEIEPQVEPQSDVEDRSSIRSPVRDHLAPRADGGLRHNIAQREQERRWERHPGEWRAMEPEQQQQLQLDEPEQIDPSDTDQQQQMQQQQQAQQPSRVYQQLQVGQQVTLTGEVQERGGLRGILIDEYGIEVDGLESPMQAPVSDEIDQPAQDMQDLDDTSQF